MTLRKINGVTVDADTVDGINGATLATEAEVADLITAEPIPVIVRKTATQTVNNSETLVNDTHLLLPVGVNEVWEFIINLRLASTSVANIDYKFTVPTNGVIYRRTGGMDDFVNDRDEVDGTTETELTFSGGRTNMAARIHYIYVGGDTAGNLQFQWAQETATVTDTQVLVNSHIIAHKIS